MTGWCSESIASFRAGAGSPKTLDIKMDVLAPFLSTETNFSGQYQVSTTDGQRGKFWWLFR
jgi:hypothetical protein